MDVDENLNAKYAIMFSKTALIPENDTFSSSATLLLTISIFSAEQAKRRCTGLLIFVTTPVYSNFFTVLSIACIVGRLFKP